MIGGRRSHRRGPALGETRQPSSSRTTAKPILLANPVSAGQAALTIANDIETAARCSLRHRRRTGILANLNTKQAYRGQYLSFNLNLNRRGAPPAFCRPSAFHVRGRSPGQVICTAGP